MKTSQAILLSAAVLGLVSAPSAQAGFLFFGRSRDVVMQAPAPPVVVRPEVIVTAPAPPQQNCVVVVSQPPPPVPETITGGPGSGFVWVGGYWSWNKAWVWVHGRWAPRPRPAANWIPGHWQKYHDQGYRFVPGYWH